MNIKNEFTSEAIEKLRWYVYKLIDPRNGEVFYVGKGKGNRVFSHVNGALVLNDEDEMSQKMETIREIHAQGLEVIHIIHRHNLDEQTAFEVEAALIDAYAGLTNLQSGHGSNDYGPVNSEQINQMYGLPQLDKFDEEDKVLIIKIKQEFVNATGSIYETVRSCWKLSEKRKEVKQVVAVINGVIRKAYEVEKWIYCEDSKRYAFEGKEILTSKYVNKRIPDEYRKKGQASPTLYAF